MISSFNFRLGMAIRKVLGFCSLFAAGCIILVSCTDNSWQELGEGYVYAIPNYHNKAIVKDNRAVIYPNVVDVWVKDGIIFGLREKSLRPDFDDDVLSGQPYGYFAIDLARGVVHDGMSYSEFESFGEIGTQDRQ